MQFQLASWTSKPFLLAAAISAAAAAAVLQMPSPARTGSPVAAPAGVEMMRLLRDEHATMTAFLIEQDAKLRVAAAVESEPEPDQQIALVQAEPEPDRQMASARAEPADVAAAPARKRPAVRPVHLAKAVAGPPLSILPPPAMPLAAAPPPRPDAEPSRLARVFGWVERAYHLPRTLWAAAGELIEDRGPPIPPRPIPRV